MRCYFMQRGHVAAVEVLAGLNDEEAIKKSRELFEERKSAGYEGFEVWDQARMVTQEPPPATDAKRSAG